MSQSSNKELSQGILAVIAVLGVVAIVEIFVLTMMYGGYGSHDVSNNYAAVGSSVIVDSSKVEERIKPVVTLSDIRGTNDTMAVAAPVVVAVVEKSAKELYDATCMACHANRVAGAPKPGDKAAWEARYANGFDSLLASVKNGKGAMPPKGGSAYSDAELTKIIEYMLVESNLM